MPFDDFIVLKRQLEHFLASCTFCLRCLLPVLLVHVEASLGLRCRRSDIAIVLMDALNVFLVHLRLLLLVSPETLDFRLKFFFTLAQIANLRVEILNLSRLALNLVAFFLKLSFKCFLVLSEAALERRNLILKVLDLTRVHLLALIMLDLLRAHLA